MLDDHCHYSYDDSAYTGKLSGVQPTAVSLAWILNRLPEQERAIVARVGSTVGIRPSGLGVVAALLEIRRDLELLQQHTTLPFANWVAVFATASDAIRRHTPIDAAADAKVAASTGSSTVRSCLAEPGQSYSRTHETGLRILRALIFIQHFSQGAAITTSSARTLLGWLNAKQPLRLDTIADYGEIGALENLRKKLCTDADTARLLTLAIRTLALPPIEVLPNRAAVNVTIARIEPADENDIAELSAMSETESRSKDSTPPDLLRWRMREARFASPMTFSGMAQSGRRTQPWELETLVPRIASGLAGPFSSECCASLLTLLTGVLPQHFSALTVTAGAGMVVDIEQARFGWNLDGFLRKHGSTDDSTSRYRASDRMIWVPLPQELATQLRTRAASGANTLLDLFPEGPDTLEKRTKAFLRQLSVTGHRLTLGRLSRSWGRYLLTHCHDENYASAIAADYTLGSAATFNYLSLRGSLVARILAAAYRSLGLTIAPESSPLPDVRSLRCPDDETVGTMFRTLLNEVLAAHDTLSTRSSPQELAGIQNLIAPRILALAAFFCLARPTSETTLTRSRIDLDDCTAHLVDKRVSLYLGSRLTPIPELVGAWLQFYLCWLRQLAYRLRNEEPRLAVRIHCTASAGVPEGTDVSPLLFTLNPTTRDLEPLGGENLRTLFEHYRIADNGGRHWCDRLFRDQAIDSATIAAVAGRAEPGQETFGARSLAVPERTLDHARAVLDAWLASAALPHPPAVTMRHWTPTEKRFTRYIPPLLSRPLAKALRGAGYETCPFPVGMQPMAARFRALRQVWVKHRIPSGIAGLALSLVIEDGAFHRDEILSAIDELRAGGMFAIEGKWGVDCCPKSLGLRRVRLSETTVRIAQDLFNEPTAPRDSHRYVAEIERELSAYLARLHMQFPGESCFDAVLDAAEVYYTKRLPGLLSAWGRGQIFTRTTRIETIARHAAGVREHTAAALGRRLVAQPRTDANKTIGELLASAAAAVSRGDADIAVLTEIRPKLERLAERFAADTYEGMFTAFAAHLARELATITTLRRYVQAAGPFLRRLEAELARGDSESLDDLDWPKLIGSHLQTVMADDECEPGPEHATINHFLRWQGIDARTYVRSGPPPSAYTYAERPSHSEVSAAIALLERHMSIIGDAFHRAALYLRIAAEHPNRSDAIAHLRYCDVHLDAMPHFSIVPEAGGALKTRNATRSLQLRDPHTVDALRDYLAVRRDEPGYSALGHVFSRPGASSVLDDLQTIQSLVELALGQTTGSAAIRPHDLRHQIITDRIAIALDPEHAWASTLEARQFVFRVAADSGHGDPLVSIENYLHDLDRARRQWLDHLNRDLRSERAPPFLSSITGIQEAAYRSRKRHGHVGEFSLSERATVHKQLAEAMPVKMQPAAMIAHAPELPPALPSVSSHNLRTRTAIALGIRFLDFPDEVAAMTASLAPNEWKSIDAQLEILERMRGSRIATTRRVDVRRFVCEVTERQLPAALAAWRGNRATLFAYMLQAISTVGNPLCSELDPTLLLDRSLTLILHEHGIAIALSTRDGDRHHDALLRVERAVHHGVTAVRAVAARNHRRGKRFKLIFGTSSEKVLHSSYLTFLVTVSLLADLIVSAAPAPQ
jgi:hypothetical protein